MLTGLEALLEAVEVGRAAGNAVDAHLVDAAPLDFTDARAYYERDVALLSSAIISNMVKLKRLQIGSSIIRLCELFHRGRDEEYA